MNRLKKKAIILWKSLFDNLNKGDMVELINDEEGLEGAVGIIKSISINPKTGNDLRYHVLINYKYNSKVLVQCKRKDIKLVP